MYAPDYQKYFKLYLAVADTTIAMVLVQEDNGIEHPVYYLSRSLNDIESKYSYVEKLSLAAVQAVQRFRHYILFRKTTILSDCNPMTYILLRQLLGGKYSKWIAILQEFDLEFIKSKSKKFLAFAELLCNFPSSSNDSTSKASIVDESLFLILSSDLWCLAIEEAEKVLNDFHSGTCGGNQSGYAMTQKILRAGYFWSTMFKDCIIAVRSCHACQIFDHKTRIPPRSLHPEVFVGPFAKWGIDFMTCNPNSARGHGYIIVVVNYFTKWIKAMPTLNNSGKTTALFFFNHVVSRFGVPQAIDTDHGSHFCNHMMAELAAKLGLSHDSSALYYLQANRQVEAINKVLKRMLQRMIGVHKQSWHLILYSTLWAYRTPVRNATRFTPFQLVYGLEAVLPVQCEISSLKLVVDLLPRTS
eukprot:PITA_30526